ncbi:M23 family metallopeptidase [Candidatus Woesearchaeota archaeon]|nr:M23 family metallopeptidase [Candidatus Woesearchaeota archaeon]
MSEIICNLPIEKDRIIKAISDPRAHYGHFREAIDFLIREGTPIYAVLPGEVLEVKVDSNEGGFDPKYNNVKYLNYITIAHDNGLYSQYAHLQFDGSSVKEGDRVEPGQLLGYSGNTGLSGSPHLHFMLFKDSDNEFGVESIRPRFKENITIDRTEQKIPKEFKDRLEYLNKLKKEYEN